MRKVRFTIGWLMILVLVLAIGLAALKSGGETWAGLMLLVTCGVLGLAVIGAVCCREVERVWWLGFALFGWGYMALAFWLSEYLPKLPTLTLLELFHAKFSATPQFVDFDPAMGGGMGGQVLPLGAGFIALWSSQIGHCLWALLFAMLGGVLARALFGATAAPPESPEVGLPRPIPSPRKLWRRPAVIGLVGLALFLSISLAGSRSAPALTTGATFLLTWGLLGVAALGAIIGHGKRREIWLGATVFGTGYMILALVQFTVLQRWPYLPTNQLLYALWGGDPRVASGSSPYSANIAAANGRILEALEQPVPMRFSNETPLDDVLKYIKQATTTPSYTGIPIYVNPLGLQEAERSLNSTVSIDLEGVPLTTSLKLAVEQIGLTYFIKDGVLMISSAETEDPPMYPFLIFGHCLLALIAAGLGSVLAPLLSDARRERSDRAQAKDAPVPAPSH